MFAQNLRSLVFCIAAAATLLPAPAAAQGDRNLPFVAVTAIVRDASIDALYTGMTDALRDAGYRDGDTVRLRFESAESDEQRAGDLVRAFGRERADVVVAFTEPSIRIAAGERLRAPLVVAGIDAAAANELRRDREARFMTGVVDGVRYDSPLALIREITPNVRTVAVPVNADEPVSAEAMRQMTAFARSIDLAVEQLPVSLDNEVVAAAIHEYSPDDTVLLIDKRIFPDAPVARLIAAAETTNLLVYATDQEAVVRGALAAIVNDSYGTGRQIGDLVARILDRPSAARLPLQPAEPTYVIINKDTATRVGIEIPAPVLARRGRVISWADIAGPRPRGKPVVRQPPPSRQQSPADEPVTPRSTPPDPAR